MRTRVISDLITVQNVNEVPRIDYYHLEGTHRYMCPAQGNGHQRVTEELPVRELYLTYGGHLVWSPMRASLIEVPL